MSKDLHASMRAAAKLTAEDTDEMDNTHTVVRAAYAARVEDDENCWGTTGTEKDVSLELGYTEEDIKIAGDGNLGEGCGNPRSFAKLKPGEVVVDLGSGAGFDAMLAGVSVTSKGQVVGVDMTPEMISKARKNVKIKGKSMSHVSFRLGEIEYLPIANDFADVVMSNCVINLSPDKQQVYREAFRVLKPGGRLAIADVVAMREIPKHLRTAEALACWVSGAAKPDDVSAILKSVGFVQVSITQKPESKSIIKKWMPGSGAEEYVCSANIIAVKPGTSKRTVEEDDDLPLCLRM